MNDYEKGLIELRKVYDDLIKMKLKRTSCNYDLWKSTIYLAKSYIHRAKFCQQLELEDEEEKQVAK